MLWWKAGSLWRAGLLWKVGSLWRAGLPCAGVRSAPNPANAVQKGKPVAAFGAAAQPNAGQACSPQGSIQTTGNGEQARSTLIHCLRVRQNPPACVLRWPSLRWLGR
ncbi:hypothetical protein DJ480_15640 [Pseudomonas sp. Leaf98]|nr:hypothetical protein DJ480_15640 [Pseudomonas sp. Leaf98]